MLIMMYFPPSPTKLPSIAAKAALLAVPMDQLQSFTDNVADIDKSRKIIVGGKMMYDSSASLSVWSATENDMKIRSNTRNAFGNDDMLTKSIVGSDIDNIVNNLPYQYRLNTFTLKQHLINLCSEYKYMICNISTILVAIIGGVVIGVFTAWNGVLQDMIGAQSALKLSSQSVGILGSEGTVCCILGGVVIGCIVDKWFAKRLKLVIMVLFIAMIVCMGLLLFVVPSPWKDKPMILVNGNGQSNERKVVVIGVLGGLSGILLGGAMPLFYELCAEVSYPVSEGSSASLLVFIENIALLLFVGLAGLISTEWQTLFVVITCVLCLVLLIFVKEKYQRM